MAQPHTVNRMALMILMLFLFTAGALQAATLVNENFTYATGQLTSYGAGANVSGGNWTNISGTGYLIPVVNGNLSYPSYTSSGVGRMIQLISPTGSAEDVKRDFTTQTTGASVYASFLLNVTDLVGLAPDTSANADYFIGLFTSTSTSTYYCRVAIRKSVSAGSYRLGLRASANNTTTWDSTNLAPGTTYLVAMKYVLVSGKGNDSCLLWINPALAATEPAPQMVQTVASADPGDIGRFAIRQGNNGTASTTPDATIDGIIVGTAWADLTPFSVPSVLVTAPANNEINVPTYATVTATFDRAMNTTTVDTASFTLTGLKQAKYYADSIRPANGGASFVFYVKDSLRKADTVTATLSTAIADPNGTHLASAYSWHFYTVLPETIRPYLTSSVPANGTNHVAITNPIVLNFSEQLWPATVDTHSIWVEGRRTPRYRLSAPTLSNGNSTVTVHLVDTLFYRDTVTVHITAGVTDAQANAMRDTGITFATTPRPGLTIYDLQYPGGNSSYAGQTVTVTGVVTATTSKGFYLQDGSGYYNGIFVYHTGPAFGDSITMTGPVQDWYGLTELTLNGSNYTVLKSNATLPAPVVVHTGDFATATQTALACEAVLVEVRNAVVTTADTSGNARWSVNDGTGVCIIDSACAHARNIGYKPALNDTLIYIRGVLYIDTPLFAIEPRFASDIMDRRPVKISSTIPALGDSNVPTSVAVTINYNKPVRPDSTTAGHFRMTGSLSGAVPFSASYDSVNIYSYLVPQHLFTQHETVTVRVSYTVVDTMGHGLDGNGNGVASGDSTDDYVFKFVTIGNMLTIAQVQKPDTGGYNSAMVGQTVTIQGVLTGPAKYFSSSGWSNSSSMYIQDATGGVNVFASGVTMADGRIGPQSALGTLCVVANATVTEYSGVTEMTADITGMKFWGKAPQLPVPDTMIYNQFMTEDMEGKLMCVSGTVSSPPSYAGGGYNMEIRNGDAPLAIRFSETAGFAINQFPIGTKVQITGVASQYDKYPPYDAGFQLVPRFSAPYTYHGVEYPADMSITVDSVAAAQKSQIVNYTPNQFCPDWGEVVTIEVNGPLSDHLTLTIYDLKGRLVRTLLNNVPGGHQVCYWDGKDDAHRLANIGIYIMHLRSVSATGNVVDQNKILVLGTPLK